MNTSVRLHLDSLRTVAGSCLILSIPSVSLSPTLNSGLSLGVTSAAILLVLTRLNMNTFRRLAAGCMLAVTLATSVSILFSVLWPSSQWDVSTFSLLAVLNVVLLGGSLNRSAAQQDPVQWRQALLTSALFVVAMMVLLLLKTAFGHTMGELPGSIAKPFHLPWLLYPGGIALATGLLYSLFES